MVHRRARRDAAAARQRLPPRPGCPQNARMSTLRLDDPAVRAALVPTGRLRASINLGNPVLANADPATGRARGVSVDLAQALAERLDVPLETIEFGAAAKSVEAVSADAADVGFFAIDPARGASIAFTDAYLLIEGAYLVRADSPLQANEEVDRAGTRIVVGQGSAYDLHLTRQIKAARFVRVPTGPAIVETLESGGADVAGGIRQALADTARERPGLRLLPGRFMVIRQAMGLPRRRGEAAAAALAAFVEEMKASGFVAAALARHGVAGACVAPPAGT
jgi:polar amino acid transport system substrate-binding protein